MTSNEFTKQFFTTFKPDITGKYTITIYNLGNSPVSIGVLVGNLPFVGANNQLNFNSLSGIIAGVIPNHCWNYCSDSRSHSTGIRQEENIAKNTNNLLLIVII